MEDIKSYYYYNSEHNTWPVMFYNKTSLVYLEVVKIFSKFGEIQSFHVTTPEKGKGNCYVNFTAESSAVECVKGMKNHEIVQLKPYKSRSEGKIKKYDLTRKLTNDGSLSLRKHEKRFKNSEDDIHTSTTSLASTESSSSLPRKIPAQKNNYLLRGKEKKEINRNASVGVSGESITAHEVIVANIPETFGVGFVLDLFEKFDPIAATTIKQIPKYSLRYCHVYFMESQQAREVEANYDHFKLGNRNLIVLRRSTLSAENNNH